MRKTNSTINPAEVMPNLATLTETRARLSTEDAELAAEDFKLAHEIAGSVRNTDARLSDGDPGRAERVARLLGRAPQTEGTPLLDRRVEIAQRRADIRLALEQLRREIDAEKSKGSAIIREKIAPLYRDKVRAICVALLAVHEASADLRKFTEMLDDNSVSWTGLGVAFPNFAGDPRYSDGPLLHYLNEMADMGFINRAEVPEVLK